MRPSIDCSPAAIAKTRTGVPHAGAETRARRNQSPVRDVAMVAAQTAFLARLLIGDTRRSRAHRFAPLGYLLEGNEPASSTFIIFAPTASSTRA